MPQNIVHLWCENSEILNFLQQSLNFLDMEVIIELESLSLLGVTALRTFAQKSRNFLI